MFKTYRVGSILGIPFKLDITFLIILPLFAWLIGGQIDQMVPLLNESFGTSIDPDALAGGIRPFLIGLTAAILLFTCVLLHELGHSVMAMTYDYEIDSITLWLLGGIAQFTELPREWKHEFWIAIAGPAVNIVILVVCMVLLAVIPPFDIAVFLIIYIALLNVVLVVFNMMPAFPLDGGRVLRALLARNQTYLQATRQASAIGKGFAIVMAFVGILVMDFILIAIALFVYIAAGAENRQMMLDAAFEGVIVEDVMTPGEELHTVSADMPLSELLDIMMTKRHTGYPVLRGGEFVGIVTVSDVESFDDPDATVADMMTPVEQLQTAAPDSDVMDAFRELSRNNVGRLPVIENGELVGLTTRTDLMMALKVVMQQRRFEEELDTLRQQERISLEQR